MMKQPKTAGKVTLTIASSNGELTDDFPVHMKAGALKHSVMGKLNMDPSQADRFCLVVQGTKLDESKTLGELGLVDDTVVVLEPCEIVQI